MSLIRTTMAALALSVSALGAQAADVKWASRADIYSLDPNSIASTANLAFLNHIYEGLVRYDKTFGLEQALATEWELVDGKTWRFKLREGVKSMTAPISPPMMWWPRSSAPPTRPRRSRATCPSTRTSARSTTIRSRST